LSFSLKVILILHSGPWKFWKLQNSPFLLPPAPSSVFPRRRCAEPSPAQWRACPATFCIALAPTRRAAPPPPPIASRWSSPAVPCRPEPPHGRHLAVAMARPRQRPPPSPSARPSTTNTPKTESPHSFALSSPPHPRTAPPPRLNSDELHPAVAPPFQSRSAQIDHANSFASLSCSLPATSRRPSSTGTPSPSILTATASLSAVEPPP